MSPDNRNRETVPPVRRRAELKDRYDRLRRWKKQAYELQELRPRYRSVQFLLAAKDAEAQEGGKA